MEFLTLASGKINVKDWFKETIKQTTEGSPLERLLEKNLDCSRNCLHNQTATTLRHTVCHMGNSQSVPIHLV
jgi:hypothetical protein